MPYPCSPFYADIKSDNRFDNRFYIRLWNSIHVKPYHKFGNKIYGMFYMDTIPKSNVKSVIKFDISFDISIKQTTWIGHDPA